MTRDLAVGVGERVVLMGAFEDSLTVGDETVTAAGETDAFAASFDAAGDLQWITSLEGTGRDAAAAAAFDQIGNVLIVGDFEESLSIDVGELS